MNIKFALCKTEDKLKIVKFMDENWGEKHVLIHNEEFYNFYYKAKNSKNLQFATASENGEILAIVGYIYANNSEQVQIWASIWCAKKGKNGIGLELMHALPKLTNAKLVACNNIRKNTMAFYEFLGYKAMRLPHFYRLCKKTNKAGYKVAKIENANILPYKNSEITFKLIKSENELSEKFTFIDNANFYKPHKDLWYIKRRYFNFPHQKYEVYGVYENKKPLALFIARTVGVNGTNVLRILDFIGNSEIFAQCGTAIDALMQEKKAEYADCYCYGFSEDVFAAAGFCKRGENSKNIIPNYLTPPLYENTEYYFFTSDDENFAMFKADGDQDRPNIKIDI